MLLSHFTVPRPGLSTSPKVAVSHGVKVTARLPPGACFSPPQASMAATGITLTRVSRCQCERTFLERPPWAPA